MTITEERKDSVLNLIVSGRLDTTTAPELETKVKESAAVKGVKALFLDLQDVEYISSAGLRVVLLAHKLMESTGNSMAVQNPSDFCRQVFEATGMDSVLNII